ncbi:MAG: type IV secretion system DNA-binding domain-containing protein, partial [Acidobacteriota bacterium]
PSDTEYPVGFNLLAAHSDLEATLLASDLVAVFRRLSTSWGDQMHSVLANAIQAFLSSKTGGSLSELRRFLVEPEFREQFLTTVDDEETVYYWRKEFPLLVGKPQGPILTRLDTFLRPKPLRQIFTQQENRIDFRDILDGGRIFLAKLAQGAIGEENAALLGSLIVAKFHQAAMSRQELAKGSRRNFHLVIDEFQEMVTPSLTPILAGTRKFGLGLTAAHQDLRSLYDADQTVANALLANAATRVVFRVSDEDANRLADGFSAFPPPALRSLGVGQAVCRVDRADWDFNLETRQPPPVDPGTAEARRQRAIEHSRATYSRKVFKASPPRDDATVVPTISAAPEQQAPAMGLEALLERLKRTPVKDDENE